MRTRNVLYDKFCEYNELEKQEKEQFLKEVDKRYGNYYEAFKM